MNEEYITHGTADQLPVCVMHETFEYGGTLPRVARQNLLKAVQRLDTGQCRLCGNNRFASTRHHTVTDLFAPRTHTFESAVSK